MSSKIIQDRKQATTVKAFQPLCCPRKLGQRDLLCTSNLLAFTIVLVSFISALQAQSKPLRGPIQSLGKLDRDRCYSFPLLEQGTSFVDRRELPASLGWVTSGMWQGAELKLVNHMSSQLVTVFPGGFVKEATKSELGSVEPWFIAPRPSGGYVLLDGFHNEGRLFFADKYERHEYMPIRGKELFDEADRPYTIHGIFQAVPMGNGVLALAEASHSIGEKIVKFLYIDRNRDFYHPFNLFDHNLDLRDLLLKFYSKDLSYIGSAGNEGYVLVLEDRPWVARVEFGSSRYTRLSIPSFDNDRLHTPQVDSGRNIGSRRDYIEYSFKLYQIMDHHRMVIGIYVSKGHLFVLIKSDADPISQEITWHLIEMSRKTGSQIGPAIELPTHAQNITLIPGDDYWAIVEKGRIDILKASPQKAILYRPARSAVLVPAKRILETRYSQSESETCEQIAVRAPSSSESMPSFQSGGSYLSADKEKWKAVRFCGSRF